MKKFSKILILMLVLVMTLGAFSGCRPADDTEDEWAVSPGSSTSGETMSGETTPGETTPGETTPGETTPGNTPGETTPGKTPSDTTPNNTPSNDQGPSNSGPTNNIPAEETIAGNPLIKEGKKINTGAACSFDIDKTGFCKSGTLADLKGKKLQLFTAVDYGMFSYRNQNGKSVNEWEWFREIKKIYGITVAYTRCTPGGSNVVKPFQAMSAGKDCDVITTHVSSFPYICNILAPLDSYFNFDKINSSPGMDPQITQATRWKGKNIVLGPCLTSGAWTYNATYIKNEGLADPYDLWKKGEWNWTNFKKYMVSLPETTKQGKQVIGASTWSQYWYWANTNGKACFEIDGDDPNGGIVNNFDSKEVKETYVWLEGVMDAGGYYWDGNIPTGAFWNTNKQYFQAMQWGVGVDVVGILEEENKSNVYKWVPFPKNEKNPNAINHVEIYGTGIGMPRKTGKENNRTIAAKFIELWVNRFTESKYDHLISRAKWTHAQVEEYYNFGKTNGRFGLGSGVGKLATYAGGKDTYFNKSIMDKSLSTAACMAKLSNYAKQEVANVLKFGIQ